MTRAALVTGGNRGIGEHVCRELARLGWDVLLAARDQITGESVAAHLRRETVGRVDCVPLDVTRPDSITDLVRRLERDAIRLHALVNNAGVYGERRGAGGTRRTIQTNFFGPLRLTEALLPVRNDAATITNVTSELGELVVEDPVRPRRGDLVPSRRQPAASTASPCAPSWPERHRSPS